MPPIALAFCAGAALRLAVRLPEAAALALALACGVGLLLARERPALGISLALALTVALGAARTGLWLDLPPDTVARLSGLRWARLHGTVIAGPETRDWGAWMDLAVARADTRREPVAAAGRVRVYLNDAREATTLRYGDRVAVEGRVTLPDAAANPGEIPPAQYLRREGIVATLSARTIRREPGRGGDPVMALALRARRMLERGIEATSRPAHAGLLRGLLFSDTAALPDGAREDFVRSGTVHILSTSGVHVALLSGLMAFLVPARRPSARKARSLALIGALLFFALMTGLRPAVARAVLMTGAALAAPLFDREPDAWCALALAALGLVLWSPGNLLDPGFQLSFAAAAALALWFTGRPAPDASTQGGRPVRWARASVEVSIIASLATWPLAARYFGSVSLAAPLTNLIVVPLVAPAMALGLLQGLLWPVAPTLAMAAGAANGGVLGAILGTASTVSGWPWAAVEVFAIGAAGIVIALGALFGLLALCRLPASRPGRAALRPTLAAMGAAGLAAWLGWLAWSPRPLRVTFLDVGQADATLVQTPGGRVVLVDAGGRYDERRAAGDGRAIAAARHVGERVVVPALKRAGVSRIDVVVLTHPHEDHAGGLPAVLSGFPVDMWLDSGQPHPSPGYRDALRIADERDISLRLARAGQRLELEPGVSIDILAPEGDPSARIRDDLNNNSVVCHIRHGETAFLLCGDAEEAREARLVQGGRPLRADVLKVGHHGGAAAATAPFLRAVAPSAAVISCGRHNLYGHPADATLQRLEAEGIRVFRTDRDGAIVATSDGTCVRLKTSRWFP